jgi:O-acetyl-ADP-ribose deacetylase (regulator of RNase III)
LRIRKQSPIKVKKIIRSPSQCDKFKKYVETPSEKSSEASFGPSTDLVRIMKIDVKGDITEIKCDYLCQQTNCVGTYPGGLAKTIAEKLGVNPYKLRTPSPGRRNFAITKDHNRMGDVTITKSPVKDVKVVCMFAQYYPGKIDPKIESMAEREDAFEVCLRKMDREIPRNATIAFPKYIGCGIAGGIWENYLRKITKFSINRNVYVVDYDGIV